MKNETYEEFVEKFKPKKTTDDCYTPPEIYEVIKDWVCWKYQIDEKNIIRPFWPGADYKTYEYLEECVVLDNPPFSIVTQICQYYAERSVKFFLFAPSLTAFASSTWNKVNHIICDADIIYENGAKVKTSFVTNLDEGIIAQTEPELGSIIEKKMTELKRKKTKILPKYKYPENVITAAMLQKMSKLGIKFAIRKEDCTRIRRLDAQIDAGKQIFGAGLLIAEKAAAEKAAAEKAAAEKAAAEKAAAEKAAAAEEVIEYVLSDREKEIVKSLGYKLPTMPE